MAHTNFQNESIACFLNSFLEERIYRLTKGLLPVIQTVIISFLTFGKVATMGELFLKTHTQLNAARFLSAKNLSRQDFVIERDSSHDMEMGNICQGLASHLEIDL